MASATGSAKVDGGNIVEAKFMAKFMNYFKFMCYATLPWEITSWAFDFVHLLDISDSLRLLLFNSWSGVELMGDDVKWNNFFSIKSVSP